jgi:hypothetical protein
MSRYLEPVAALRTLNNPLVRSLHERAVLRGIGDGPKRPLLGIFQGLTDAHVVDSSFLRTLNKCNSQKELCNYYSGISSELAGWTFLYVGYCENP